MTLIAVPLSNIETTWVRWINELLPSIPLTYAKGKKRQLLRAVKEFQCGIFLIHHEGLCSVIKQLRRKKWSLVMIDEAHRAKDRGTLFSRSIAKLSSAPRKVIFTGTPLESYPHHLWAQLRFLAPDIFGTRWADFDEEYMEQPDIKNRHPKGSERWKRVLRLIAIKKRKLKFRTDKLPKFIALVKDILWREELPSPKPRFHIEHVRMFGEQRRLYDKMDTHQVIRVDGVRIMAPLEITKRVKLHQICGGTVLDEDGVAHRVGRAKLRRCLGLVEKHGAPAVLFCQYREEVEWLMEFLPDRVGVISGKIERPERIKVQQDFQSGKLDYVICQTRTGGVGIDLFRAKYLIVYSTTHSSIDFEQLVSRIRLPEQTEPIDVFLIVVSDSVDEDKRLMLRSKSARVGGVLSQLKRS